MRRRGCGGHGAEVRDDGERREIGEVIRRHRGARDAASDYGGDVVVRFGAAEFAVSEIDAGNAVALRAVTDRAVRAKEPPAILDVDGRETVLCKQGPGRQDHHREQSFHFSAQYIWNVDLKPYRDTWPSDDRHANFKAEVACYSVADPLPTLENLSKGTGIPVGCLIRYVLVKYAASGSEAMMAMDPIVFRQMREHVARAEEDGSEAAKIKAYAALKDMIAWLG